jgi:hypothetical protein
MRLFFQNDIVLAVRVRGGKSNFIMDLSEKRKGRPRKKDGPD